MLARCLDLLKAGRLDQLADVLASRMIAVDTATRQGWNTARFLEILDDGEEGSAPTHVLLAAQRHSRLVERAGGKGSWSRQQTWQSPDWGGEGRPKGKGKEGKGKSKKGKNKNRGGKNQWNSWQDDKAKPGDSGQGKKEGEK